MSFFCLPIFFGCPTQIKLDSGQPPRMCPRCNNASVYPGRSRTWFELCFVKLVPISSTQIWDCTICRWEVPLQPNWEPAMPGIYQPPPNAPGQPGYPGDANQGYGPPPVPSGSRPGK